MKKPSGYCECDCGGKTAIADKNHTANGYVKGWPRRFLNGHSTRGSGVDYIVDPETDCWIWQLSVDKTGYGRIHFRGEGTTAAHRWFYEQTHGLIPNGLDLDHLCHNDDENCLGNAACVHRRCVNPEHLEPVARAENIQRGRASKLDYLQVEQIRSLCAQGWVKSDIAGAYGITGSHVSKIANGGTWAQSS